MLSKYNYTASIIFISFWWLIALKTPVATQPNLLIENFDKNLITDDPKFFSFSTLLNLDRNEIQKALDGDVSLMKQLIYNWDLESEFLEQQGIEQIKRIPRKDYIKSQMLAKILTTSTPEVLNDIQELVRKKLIIDFLGNPIDLNHKIDKLLPQTYFSAAILMSIVSDKKIVSLPKGMRKQKKIYPEKIMNQIEMDLDNYQSEKIFKISPDLAIISPSYSHPSTFENLRNQEIPIFNMDSIRSIENLKKAINDLGQISQQPLKSELLTIFIDAALNAIDNKRIITNKNLNPENTLIVNFHTHFSLPAKNTIIYELIKRLGNINPWYDHHVGNQSWSYTLKEEDLIAINPEHLLIITLKNENSLNFFYQTEIFKYLNAAKNDGIKILDEEVLQNCSQYIVLAYYDINNSLCDLEGSKRNMVDFHE